MSLTLGPSPKEHWSFPRSPRFPKIKPQGLTPYLPVPSTLKNNGPGLGFGDRYNYVKLLRHKETPSPSHYSPSPKNRLARIDFGYKYKFIDNGVPGVGSYKLGGTLGRGKPKFSMTGHRRPKPLVLDTPSPHSYLPKKLSSSRFSGIGFGFGDRNMHQYILEGPGPGTYNPR